MRTSEAKRAMSLLVLGLAACAGSNDPDGEDDSGVDWCSPPRVGSTCVLTLTPGEEQGFSFLVPGEGQTRVVVSLTGSTTQAFWVLEGPLGPTSCADFTFGRDQSCIAVVVGGAPHLLRVREAEGRAGTTSLTISHPPSTPGLGSPTKPVPLSTNSLMNGSVAANGSSYFSFTSSASADHAIALTGQFAQLSWELFRDPGLADQVAECSTTSQAEDLVCRVPLAAGSRYFLRVREFSGAPQEFRLTVGSGALNEGAPQSPVSLVVGERGRPSTVDVFGHSYFTFTPSTSGPHSIQLDRHTIVRDQVMYSFPSDYGWTLFDDPGFTHVVKECRDYRDIPVNAFERCVASLTAGVPYYLRVDEQAGRPNRIYELTVVGRTGGGGTSEGTVGAPVPASFTLGWGRVAARGSSYYSFRTSASAESYRIIATSARDDFYFAGSNLAWSLFDDPGFSSEIARCENAKGVVAQSCLTPGLAASTTYYLRVDENDGIAQEFGLTLYGGFAPPTPSSPESPVAVPVGSEGVEVVQDNTLSTGYYSFTTSQAGTYRITSNLATGDLYGLVAWSLYDDPAFSRQVARCFEAGPVRSEGTSCTVRLPGGTSFYLKVRTVGAQSGYPGSTIIGGNDLRLVVDRLSP